MQPLFGVILLVLISLGPASGPALGQTTPAATESEGFRAVAAVIDRNPLRQIEALKAIAARGNPDVAHALVDMLGFFPFIADEIVAALRAVTGDDPGDDRKAWMLWMQMHPDIASFPDYDRFKGWIYSFIDPDFARFIHPGVSHDIRLEEVTWGGVAKDGIPALDNPTLIAAADADYLTDGELVFGVSIGGDVRAYPLRVMDWHEMFNDVVGGVPVSLAYCTLCGSGILYETAVDGRDEPFTFGSSGFLYRSNKLMYDRQTNSLWNQFTGEPVVGALAGSGVRLEARPVTIATWEEWRARHPDTRVLSLETGFERDYTPGQPYGDYFASPDLMFPVALIDERLPPKAQVFVLRADAGQKAWPISAFSDEPVINDRIGDFPVVLVGDPATRTVRAYETGGLGFQAADGAAALVGSDGSEWSVGEDALTGPGEARLARLPGHIAYWFAWAQFFPDSPVYGGD